MPNIELQRSGSGDVEIKLVITKEAVETFLSFIKGFVEENEEEEKEESTKEAKEEVVREGAKANLLANSLGSQAGNNNINNIIAKASSPIANNLSNSNVSQLTNEPPTLEEVQDYGRERRSCVNCVKFFNYYKNRQWKDRSGEMISDWKALFQSWERTEFNQTYKQPIKPKEREFIPTEFN